MAARIPQLYQPRKPPAPSLDQPNPFASADNLDASANSAAQESANLSSIGGLLFRESVWQGDEDDNDPPPAPVVRTGRARSNTIASTVVEQPQYVEVDRAILHARVRSVQGDVDGSDDDYDSDDKHDEPMNVNRVGGDTFNRGSTQPLQVQRAQTPQAPRRQAPTQQQAGILGQRSESPLRSQASVKATAPTPSVIERPTVVVNFPTPNIVPAPSWAPPTPSTPTHPNPPKFPGPDKRRPTVQVQLPVHPNAQPVSPMLAAPPTAHFKGPMTPPASPSLRGFDHLKEKGSTFREDDTEVMNPLSPRAIQSGPRPQRRQPTGTRLSSYRPGTTIDFWKRFSTMHKMEKESGWIRDRRKRSIWLNPLFVVPLVLVSRRDTCHLTSDHPCCRSHCDLRGHKGSLFNQRGHLARSVPCAFSLVKSRQSSRAIRL